MIAPRQFQQADRASRDWLDVVLSPTGKTFVDGKKIVLHELLEKLCRDSLCARRVRIFAGAACRFDHLADVYRLCKMHGIDDVELVG